MKDKKIIDTQQMKTAHQIEVEKFFKAAFCIDGDAKFLSADEITEKKFEVKGVVELNDSKRGRFYLAKLEESK